MGLDSVDLIIELEKVFKITIPDREAEKLTTVKEIYDFIWSQVSNRQSNFCKTQHIFYQLRNHFQKELSIPKSQFKLNAQVNELMPGLQRRELYSYVQENTGL